MGVSNKQIRGKYQIAKNVFVNCFVNIEAATDKEMRAFVGLKRRTFTLVPIGTKIFFQSQEAAASAEGGLDVFFTQVLDVEDANGRPLHVCHPIQKSVRPNLRARTRVPVQFPVRVSHSSAEFRAVNACLGGFCLEYQSRKVMLSLVLDQLYEFRVACKGQVYMYKGMVAHIQYDWKSHMHRVGIRFVDISAEQETVLNLLMDPSYVVEISDKQKVNTMLGKISLDEEE